MTREIAQGGKAQPFHYCPQCRSRKIRQRTAKMFSCEGCGFEFYLNPAAAVAGLIFDKQGRLLVIVRGKEPARGLWDLPGGFTDPDETAEQALKREIKEELGLEVSSLQYLCSAPNVYRYKNIDYTTVDLAFICKVGNINKAKKSDEIADVLFEKPDEIALEKFGFESIKHIVSFYLLWAGRQIHAGWMNEKKS